MVFKLICLWGFCLFFWETKKDSGGKKIGVWREGTPSVVGQVNKAFQKGMEGGVPGKIFLKSTALTIWAEKKKPTQAGLNFFPFFHFPPQGAGSTLGFGGMRNP